MALGLIQDCKNIYIDLEPHTHATWGLRSLTWIPLFIGAYITSASFVQAFLLASTQASPKLRLSPRLWNYIMIGAFVVIFVTQLVRLFPSFSTSAPTDLFR